MRAASLVLACLVCVGHGGRLQAGRERMQGRENLLSPGRSRSMRSPMAANLAGRRPGRLVKLRGGQSETGNFGQQVAEAREAFESSMAETLAPEDTMLKLHLGCLLTIYVTNNWRMVEKGQEMMRKCMAPFYSAFAKLKEKAHGKAERKARAASASQTLGMEAPGSDEALFDLLDKNRDGVISREEFEAGLRSGRFQESDLQELLSQGGAEFEDLLDEEELEILAEQQRLMEEEQLRLEEEEQERQREVALEKQRQARLRAEQQRRASIQNQYRQASVFASAPPAWSNVHGEQEYDE
mmetsp:Transcript_150876/g.289130  ORF Transcript_150876/g.289130 Transcript_150876/m.289130 type:complete len:297 (+) Transcript_150876:59-949(+)